jgi:dedicator of cytokinesis protein 3
MYRGQEYEKLAAFIQRIRAEWPNANLLRKNSPPKPKITTDSGQHLQICNVKPKPRPKGTANAVGIPDKIRSFYLVNDVWTFQYDRKLEKLTNGEAKAHDENSEFKTMWIERTTLQTAVEFPGTLRWLEISGKKAIEISPILFACEKMEEPNSHLQSLISQYAPNEDGSSNLEMRNVNPLSMRLQGMLDAAVMGGIPKYTEAFFNEEFLKQEETNNFALKLVGLLQDQVKYLEEGLEIHGKLVPPGVQPLHRRLLECHTQMKSSVQETEIYVYSTLASLNNATLRRSVSGSNGIVRDSFRKLGSGKRIVNSPLPPVPKYCQVKIHSNSNSNRSSMSSRGYGQVSFSNLN